MRGLIAGALFHQGKLSAVMTKRLGFDLVPPPVVSTSSSSQSEDASQIEQKS